MSPRLPTALFVSLATAFLPACSGVCARHSDCEQGMICGPLNTCIVPPPDGGVDGGDGGADGGTDASAGSTSDMSATSSNPDLSASDLAGTTAHPDLSPSPPADGGTPDLAPIPDGSSAG